MKKFLALFLAVLMVVLSAPAVFAVGERQIIDSYVCDNDDCTFNWVLYDDYTMVVDGEGKITHHNIVTEYPVKKVIISDTLTGLNEPVFQYVRTIETFEVSDNHPTYSTVDGVLFNKDKTVLHHYPSGINTPYFIPETVKEIGAAAFAFSKLTSITIPENVEYIGWQAFWESDLQKVYFESKNNGLFVSTYAFGYCDSLNSIDLWADQVYCICSYSFAETPFMLNEENWEDGVLYLNDILLAVDNEKIEKEYTIKDGTKCIADNALFYRNSSENENDGFVKVTIPESVNNIGYDSIINYYSLPSNLFRIGTSTTVLSLIRGYSDELTKELEEWYEKCNSIVNFEDYKKWNEENDEKISIEELKELPQWLVYFIYAYDDIVYGADPLYPQELYWFGNDYKMLSDDSINWSTGFLATISSFSPMSSDGFILNENMETLSKYTTFGEKNTQLTIDCFKAFSDGFNLEWYDENTLSKEKSLTFLNKNMKIFDSPDTIWQGYTICGYTGSTAHKYAIKYNRKFVDIESCIHSELAYVYKLEANCEREGYSGDIYCQYCGEFLYEGEKMPVTGCDFSEWETVNATTCTTDGTAKRKCSVCEYEETKVYEVAPGHKLHTEITKLPDCNNFGETRTYCENCSYVGWSYLDKLLHEDNNHDGKCDLCGEDLTAGCSCNCHKTGVMSIIYKIMRFFWKLFGMNESCSCGVKHY